MTQPRGVGRALPVWTSLAWLTLVLSQFFALWIFTWLWFAGYLLVAWLSWVPAIGLGVALIVRLVRSGRRLAAGVTAAVMLAAGLLVHTASWAGVFARTFYAVNEADFAEVVRLKEAKQLDVEGYYGSLLPLELRHLAINGRAAPLRSTSGGQEAGVLLPQWIGTQDGAVGFAYLASPPAEGDLFDGFGDNVRACLELGEGWYWLTRTGGEC